MRILLDFDEVINQMMYHWLDTLNCVYQTNVKYEDIKEWDMQKAFPTLTKEEIYNPLSLQSFWNRVKIVPNARAKICELINDGHEIYIVTSSHPDTIKWKAEWLRKELPEIPWSHVVVANDKSLINGDMLVDDGIHNLSNGNYMKVLFDKPWNQNINPKLASTIYRVHNWNEITELIYSLT